MSLPVRSTRNNDRRSATLMGVTRPSAPSAIVNGNPPLPQASYRSVDRRHKIGKKPGPYVMACDRTWLSRRTRGGKLRADSWSQRLVTMGSNRPWAQGFMAPEGGRAGICVTGAKANEHVEHEQDVEDRVASPVVVPSRLWEDNSEWGVVFSTLLQI